MKYTAISSREDSWRKTSGRKTRVETNIKLFICECGYTGYRSNDNKICKICKKEGELIELIENDKPSRINA